MRRFSSTDLFCLFLTWLATSMVICSDVSTYPSWTLSDVPTTAASLITLTSSTRFRPDAYESVTYVSGTMCYLCLRPLIPKSQQAGRAVAAQFGQIRSYQTKPFGTNKYPET